MSDFIEELVCDLKLRQEELTPVYCEYLKIEEAIQKLTNQETPVTKRQGNHKQRLLNWIEANQSREFTITDIRIELYGGELANTERVSIKRILKQLCDEEILHVTGERETKGKGYPAKVYAVVGASEPTSILAVTEVGLTD